MPISQGRNASGRVDDVAVGQLREQLVGTAYGKWYAQAAAGNLYFMTTIAAGLAIPIETTTAPLVMLWNPSNSGKNAVLVSATFALTSGSAVSSVYGLSLRKDAGSTVGTAATITAFAQNVYNTNTFGGKLGNQNLSVMRSSSQGTNTITAGVWLRPLFHHGVIVTTSSVAHGTVITYDFDGEVVLGPGTAVFVSGVAASSALFNQTLSWAEVPI